MSKLAQQRLRLFCILVILSVSFGMIGAWIANTDPTRDFWFLVHWNIRSWIFGSMLIWGFEIFYVPSRYGRWLRQQHFLPAMVIRLAGILTLTMAISMWLNFVYEGRSDWEFLGGSDLKNGLVTSVVGIAILHSALQIIRITGFRNLIYILVGRYAKPVREETIFMFLDMTGSTAAAEKLGDEGVQAMITRFFFDINPAIVEFGGRVHRYVGDQVVVTWPLSTPARNRDAIDAAIAIRQTVDALANSYRQSYGIAPDFRLGLHGGPVVISQIGDQKQELSYFGDTVNTAARIESACKQFGHWNLISEDLLGQTALDPSIKIEEAGSVQLRGRETETRLFKILPA